MARGVKVVVTIVAVLLVVVVAATWLLLSNLDSIVKRVIETAGTDALGTQVIVDDVSISLGDRTATLRGLTIDNPSGYDTDHAFRLGLISVQVEVPPVGATEVVLPQIVATQASLNYEQRGTTSNLQTLLDNLDRAPAEPEAEPPPEEAAEMKLVIQELRLNDAQLALHHDRLDEAVVLGLDNIVLRDIGRKGAGATAREAAREILEPILDRAVDAAQQRAREEVESRVREEIDKQKEKVLDQLSDQLGGF